MGEEPVLAPCPPQSWLPLLSALQLPRASLCPQCLSSQSSEGADTSPPHLHSAWPGAQGEKLSTGPQSCLQNAQTLLVLIIMNMKLPTCCTFAIDLIFYLYFNKLEALIYSKHWPPICQVGYKLFPASHLSVCFIFAVCAGNWVSGRFSILL